MVNGDTGGRIGRAAAVLGRNGLAPVVAELARRYGASARPVQKVTVSLDDPGREAVAELLGMVRLPAARVDLSCARIAAVLGVAPGELRDVVEQLAGPVGDRAAQGAATRAELDAAVDRARDAARALGAVVEEWAGTKVRTTSGPVAGRAEAVAQVCAVVAAARPVRRPLAVVAAEATGDPHAFDLDTPRGKLLAECAAMAAGTAAPVGAAGRRAALARFGVAADDVSSTVATWGLVPQPGHPFAGSARAAAGCGEPLVWTLSMVTRHPVSSWPARVLVVENPSVLAVAAADRFDGVVICTSGRPSTAGTALVAQATAAGAKVDAHADFDAGGFGVIADLMTHGARPWRMDAADYLADVDRALVAADGAAVTTPWDPHLSRAFAEHRLVLYEEQVLDRLLS